MATEVADSAKPPGHDDVYAAVFSLVGQQRNETYEDLAKVLPSIKNADPAELKELDAIRALHAMRHPPKDPLRVEYEKEDVDDLSTEEGEWIDAGHGKEDDEELDENGVAIVKLSRASSCCILDGPGDVKVDNFTPEGDADAEALAAHDATGISASAAVQGLAAAAPSTVVPAPYVPSAIARAQLSASPSTVASTAVQAGAAAVPPSVPVVTLEDQLRAMHIACGASDGPGSAPAAGQDRQPPLGQHDEQQRQRGGSSSGGGGTGGGGAGGNDDGDDPEVVPEPPGPHSLLLPPAPPPRASADGAAAVGCSGAAVGAAVLGGPAAVAAAGAAYGAAPDGPSCLPGECQNTSHEDALWRAMQGVDGRALVEHMGLAGPRPADDDESDDGANADTSGSGSGDGSSQGPGARARAAANGALPSAGQPHGAHAERRPTPGLLPNGHASLGDRAGSGSGSGEGGAPGNTGGADPAGAMARPGVAPSAQSGQSSMASGPQGDGSSDDGTAAAAAAAGTGAAEASGGQGAGASGAGVTALEDSGRQLVLRAATGAAAGGGGRGGSQAASAADADGPTFEEVEAFSLDPDFDYDNVKLTPREFPYSLLGATARWGAGRGGGAAGTGAGVAR